MSDGAKNSFNEGIWPNLFLEKIFCGPEPVFYDRANSARSASPSPSSSGTCTALSGSNPATGKADRVGIKTLEDGSKVRIFRSTGENVDI